MTTTATTTTSESEGSDLHATTTFESLGLRPEILKAIDEMGWDTPTPVQAEAYPKALEGRDLIVQARTGTGKTGAFGIPLVDRLVHAEPGVQALVLAPTRELALQSAREMAKLGKHRGVNITAVYGGAPMDRQVRELKEGAQIVSGTPGRVLDHLRRRTLDPKRLRVLVLDEADEMLSMGFAKELNAIMELLPKDRQTLLFSATVDDPIQRVAERHMTDPEFLTLSGDAVGALGVSHFVYFVSGLGRAKDLIKIVEIEDPESAVVFCNTKVETERVAAALQQAGYDADWLNGDLPQSEREKVMRRTKQGELRFLVATDVAARGIDISHLTHVVNFSLPPNVEQYVHRTGRTGRAGRTGTAISLVSAQELGSLYYLRLQYKIFPVERSLPTRGEERTRQEADRIAMLEGAFRRTGTDLDRAIARRLMTHPDAETILTGLLGAFFGSKDDADEEAAAARRARTPPATEAKEAKEAPKESRSAKPVLVEDLADDTDADDTDADDDDDGADTDEHRTPDEGMATLYVSCGRRDGVRASDLNRLLQDECGLVRKQVGRIRVRDKHTFVAVEADVADDVIAKLNGQSLKDRPLTVEHARSV